MLEEYVTLEKGDVVVQNGANSAVGQVLTLPSNSNGVDCRHRAFLVMLNKLPFSAVCHSAGKGKRHTHC